jgi:Ribosomal protein L13
MTNQPFPRDCRPPSHARVWHKVDDRTLGKLAERIAIVLMGKHKPIYDKSCVFIFSPPWPFPFFFDPKKNEIIYWQLTTTVDCGDYVVVSNALKVKVSGLKEKQLVLSKTFDVARWIERDAVWEDDGDQTLGGAFRASTFHFNSHNMLTLPPYR